MAVAEVKTRMFTEMYRELISRPTWPTSVSEQASLIAGIAADIERLLPTSPLADSETTKRWLCIGHHAWPDPLHQSTLEKAVDWYWEHVDKQPGIYLVERWNVRGPNFRPEVRP